MIHSKNKISEVKSNIEKSISDLCKSLDKKILFVITLTVLCGLYRLDIINKLPILGTNLIDTSKLVVLVTSSFVIGFVYWVINYQFVKLCRLQREISYFYAKMDKEEMVELNISNSYYYLNGITGFLVNLSKIILGIYFERYITRGIQYKAVDFTVRSLIKEWLKSILNSIKSLFLIILTFSLIISFFTFPLLLMMYFLYESILINQDILLLLIVLGFLGLILVFSIRASLYVSFVYSDMFTFIPPKNLQNLDEDENGW